MLNFRPMSRRLLAVPLAAGALLLAPSAIAQTTTPDYTKLFAKYGKKTVQAKLGGYCHPNAEGTGVCGGDYSRENMARLTIRRGGEMTVLVKHPATRIEWQAFRIDGRGHEQRTDHGPAKAVTRSLKRWKLRIPRDLPRTTDVLRFIVRYPNAFSSFGVGTKVLKAAPPRKK